MEREEQGEGRRGREQRGMKSAIASERGIKDKWEREKKRSRERRKGKRDDEEVAGVGGRNVNGRRWLLSDVWSGRRVLWQVEWKEVAAE